MPTFWIAALVMGALAAAFVLWPLRRRADAREARSLRARSNLAIFDDRLAELRVDLEEQRIDAEEFEALRAELQRSLLRDVNEEDLTDDDARSTRAPRGRAALVAFALAVPLFAVVLYADWGASLGALGELAMVDDVKALDGPADAPEHKADLTELETRLQARLEKSPDDADGWFLLGRTQLNQDQFEGAAISFGKVAELTQGNLVPLVFQTQALYLADDRTLTPRVRKVLDEVLKIDPQQPIMLELLGMDAFQGRRFAEAASLFERVLKSDISDPAHRKFLEDGRARARELAGLPPAPLVASGPQQAAGGAPGTAIHVRVTVNPDLLENLPSSARIFVLARPVDGGRMPLAVKRLDPAASLDVTLTAADAMNPAMSIATTDQVEVVVRLSMAGTAMPGSGDVEAKAGPVATDRSSDVSLFVGDGGPAPSVRMLAASAPAAAGAAPAATAGGDTALHVQVRVNPDLLTDLPASARVFVLARPAGGGRMPLAVKRLDPAASLDVTLTAADAMNPAMSIATADSVEVVARLSMAGTAMPGAGDVEAKVGPVATDRSSEISLYIGKGGPEPSVRMLDPATSAPATAAAVPAPAKAPATTGAAGTGSGTPLRVLVELDPALTPPPGATVFVFAREVGGPPMPVAVQRLDASALPTLVTLDDSMAMVPGRTLSSVGRLQVVARVSASGGVAAQPGDMEGVSATLDGVPDRVVRLLIDREIH